MAIFYLGATAVFLDEWANKKRLETCCQIADCNGFVGGWKAQLIRFISKPINSIPINLSSKKRSENKLNITKTSLEDTALITFTTGSQGTPKAAERTHGFLLEQYKVLREELTPKPTDITMTNLPIVLLINLGIGCTSIIPNFNPRKQEKLKPVLIINQIKETATTRIISSPFTIKKVAQYVIDTKLDLSQLKEIFTGGAPVFPSEADIYNKAFPDTSIRIVFGSTEVEPISSISSFDLIAKSDELKKGLPVGEIFSKTKVRIISIDSSETTSLKDDNIGEIIVSGPHVLDRYYNNQDVLKLNKITIDNILWHKTGDSGYRIENELFLTGRTDQLIRHHDNWISPFVIENKLQQINEIGTVLKKGNEVILILERKRFINELKKLIPDLKYDRIKQLSKIPRDPRHNSKFDYNKLREII